MFTLAKYLLYFLHQAGFKTATIHELVVKRSCGHRLLLNIKIDPDRFSEGKRVACPAQGSGSGCRHECMQSGFQSRGHESRRLCSAVLHELKSAGLSDCIVFFYVLFFRRVEFQNKFYAGQGFKFLPFTFESILEGRLEE